MDEDNSRKLINTNDSALHYDHHTPQGPVHGAENDFGEESMSLKPRETFSPDVKRQDTPRYGLGSGDIQSLVKKPFAHIDTSLNERKQKAVEVLKSLKKSIEAQNINDDVFSSSQIIKFNEKYGFLANLDRKPMPKEVIKQRSLRVLKSLKKMMEAEQIHPPQPLSPSISNENMDDTTDSDSEAESVVTAVNLLIRRKQSSFRDTEVIKARRTSTLRAPESDTESVNTLIDDELLLHTPRAISSDLSVNHSDYAPSSADSDTDSIVSVVGAVERLRQLQELKLTSAVEDNENEMTQKQLVALESMHFAVNDINTCEDSSIDGIIPYDFLKIFMKDFDGNLEKAAVHVKYGKQIECTCFNSTRNMKSCMKHIETANLQFFDESVEMIQMFCNFRVDETEYFFAECSLRENCPNYYKNQIAKLPLYFSEEFLSKNTERRRQFIATFERILREEDLLLKSLEDELIIGRKRNIIATSTDADFNLAIDFMMKEYPALFVQIIKERKLDELSKEISLINANRKVIIEKHKLSQKELHVLENYYSHE
ncbi:hypothetical protein WA026_010509 [Henosepilachna vigintioctopunctata]|uniref:Uncharacterized protein n=1 Tax=Henosepilachna vigintioctopunctata TaxID=420089 RepID=A0AAW1VE81_9CUCU